MSDLNRRNMILGLAALAGAATAAKGQTSGGSLGASRVFVPQMKKMPNGSERWEPFAGTLGTGESVSLHESLVPAGTPGAALHKISHSELIFVAEGTLEFAHDGITEKAEAGSIVYVAYGTNHAVRNAGTSPARYVVIAIGGDTKKP